MTTQSNAFIFRANMVLTLVILSLGYWSTIGSALFLSWLFALVCWQTYLAMHPSEDNTTNKWLTLSLLCLIVGTLYWSWPLITFEALFVFAIMLLLGVSLCHLKKDQLNYHAAAYRTTFLQSFLLILPIMVWSNLFAASILAFYCISLLVVFLKPHWGHQHLYRIMICLILLSGFEVCWMYFEPSVVRQQYDHQRASTRGYGIDAVGFFSDLQQSNRVAFVVKPDYKNTYLGSDLLGQYWRTQVFDRIESERFHAPVLPLLMGQNTQSPVAFANRYILTTKSHQGPFWPVPAGAMMLGDRLKKTTKSLWHHEQDADANTLSYTFIWHNNQGKLQAALSPKQQQKLKDTDNLIGAKARQLIDQLSDDTTDTATKISHIKDHFQTGDYRYQRQNAQTESTHHHWLDHFLFAQKRGVCAQYAASVALILRAMDVPARLVGGYYGGELSTNNELVVREKDAHVWVEYWHQGVWQRVDPTSWLPPELLINEREAIINIVLSLLLIGSLSALIMLFMMGKRIYQQPKQYRFSQLLRHYLNICNAKKYDRALPIEVCVELSLQKISAMLSRPERQAFANAVNAAAYLDRGSENISQQRVDLRDGLYKLQRHLNSKTFKNILKPCYLTLLRWLILRV